MKDRLLIYAAAISLTAFIVGTSVVYQGLKELNRTWNVF